MCLCGMHCWIREVKWLNYTPETTCNNWYIVQLTLLKSIYEYSKHPHFNASQNVTLTPRARIDLLILWLLKWICSAVSWKCSSFYKWNFIVLKSTHNYQKTSSSRLSQISLNFYCSAFLSLGFVDRPIDFIFWEFNRVFLEICHSLTHIVPVCSHTKYTLTVTRNIHETIF